MSTNALNLKNILKIHAEQKAGKTPRFHALKTLTLFSSTAALNRAAVKNGGWKRLHAAFFDRRGGGDNAILKGNKSYKIKSCVLRTLGISEALFRPDWIVNASYWT